MEQMVVSRQQRWPHRSLPMPLRARRANNNGPDLYRAIAVSVRRNHAPRRLVARRLERKVRRKGSAAAFRASAPPRPKAVVFLSTKKKANRRG